MLKGLKCLRCNGVFFFPYAANKNEICVGADLQVRNVS